MAARRIFAFALMIRDGIPADEVEPYLHARAWLTDAACLLDVTPEVLAAGLVTTMLGSDAVVVRDGRLHASADHTPVAPETLSVPRPLSAWTAHVRRRRSELSCCSGVMRGRGWHSGSVGGTFSTSPPLSRCGRPSPVMRRPGHGG
ncbi:hypothetical protein ACFQ2K_08585 [Streptomyces sanglieri]|uniref:Uncharacterized protein n=1 Tax=Streptomyces sanglieri TaxID=193460 RepID=A0ABW2WPP2_9ACTN